MHRILPSRRSLILSAFGAALARSSVSQTPEPLHCDPRDDTIGCFMPWKFGSNRFYVAGEGPPVLILHELPGLAPYDIRLAKRLVQQGYTVLLPLLFGYPGDDRFLHYYNTICGSDQFDCGGSGKRPKPIDWLLALSGEIRKTWSDGLGIGVIGMCLSGEFPLVLLQNKEVKAAVLCQPTDPFNILTFVHLGPGSKLSLSGDDIDQAAKSDLPILGIRYTNDLYCPASRFETLEGKLKKFYRLDLKPMKGMSHHSSLGKDFCQTAFDEVCPYLGSQLKNPAAFTFPRCSKQNWGSTRPRDCEGNNNCGS
jgi:dienelactone hydrolase